MTYEDRQADIIRRYQAEKERKVKLEERLNLLMENAEKEFGVHTPQELADKMDKTEKEIDKLISRIEPMLSKLERGLRC